MRTDSAVWMSIVVSGVARASVSPNGYSERAEAGGDCDQEARRDYSGLWEQEEGAVGVRRGGDRRSQGAVEQIDCVGVVEGVGLC